MRAPPTSAPRRRRSGARKQHRRVVERLNPGLGNKYAKQKAMEQLQKEGSSKNLTLAKPEDTSTAAGRSRFASSARFFESLQQHAQADIAAKRGDADAGRRGAMEKERKEAQRKASHLKLS